jgi:hypothetical protein
LRLVFILEFQNDSRMKDEQELRACQKNPWKSVNIRGYENLPSRALSLRLILLWHAIRAANSALGGADKIKKHLSLGAPNQVLRPLKGL